jgi:hypothetical protein
MYELYAEEMCFAHNIALGKELCRYCGLKKESEFGCPECGQRNCAACAKKFDLGEGISLDGKILCPPPSICAMKHFGVCEVSPV